MVLQEMLKNLPASMPSFDRVTIIEKFKNELGEIDISGNIPWHLLIINQEQIRQTIIEISSKLK